MFTAVFKRFWVNSIKAWSFASLGVVYCSIYFLCNKRLRIFRMGFCWLADCIKLFLNTCAMFFHSWDLGSFNTRAAISLADTSASFSVVGWKNLFLKRLPQTVSGKNRSINIKYRYIASFFSVWLCCNPKLLEETLFYFIYFDRSVTFFIACS